MVNRLLVGVFMRDLTFFNEGNHKHLSNGLINFSKIRTLVLKVCVCGCDVQTLSIN